MTSKRKNIKQIWMSVVALLLIALTASGIAYSWIEGGTTYTMETEEEKGITIKAPQNYQGILNLQPGTGKALDIIKYDVDTTNYSDLIFSPMSSNDGEIFYITDAVDASGNAVSYRRTTTSNDVGKSYIDFSFDYKVPENNVYYLALKSKPTITATKSGVAVSDVSPFRILLSNGEKSYIFAGDGTENTANVVTSTGGGTVPFKTAATSGYILNSTTTKNRLFSYKDGYEGNIHVAIWLESGANSDALDKLRGCDVSISFELAVEIPKYLIGYNAATKDSSDTELPEDKGFTGGSIQFNGTNKTAKGMEKITEGSTLVLKAVPETNYEFEGWYVVTNSTESARKSTSATWNVTPEEDIYNLNSTSASSNNTYYLAKFKEKPKYTINVEASPTEGGTVSVGDTNTATAKSYTDYKDEKATLVANPTKGYLLKYWYTLDDKNNEVQVSTSLTCEVTISADKTYYAKFVKATTTTIYIERHNNYNKGEYYLKVYNETNNDIYYHNGATSERVKAEYHETTGWHVYTFDTLPDAGKFCAILSKSDGSNKVTTSPSKAVGKKYLITAEGSIEEIGDLMYTISVAAYPESYGTASVSGIRSYAENVDKLMIRNGHEFKFSATSESYDFLGLYEDLDNNGVVNTSIDRLISNTANGTVSFSKIGSSAQEPTLLAYFGKASSYTARAYAVTGTTNNSSTGGTVQVDSATAGATSYKSVTSGTTVTFKATAKSGYAFEGWYTAVSGGTKLSGDLNYTATITGTTNVYARFKQSTTSYTAKAYAVSNGTSSSTTGGKVQVTGGSAGATSTATVTSGTSVTFTATKVTGYTFSGWYTAASGGSRVSKDESYTTTISSATTVYARFDRVIYFKPDSTNWTKDNARFAAYVWDGSGDKWYSMSDSDGDGIYTAIIDPKYTNVIFCRMNPANTTNNWDNKWNQTGNLTIASGKNYYQKTNDAWDGDTSGTWSTK